MLEDRKVMITGGAGFIGSNLAHHLCKRNRVVVIDNLHLGKRENLAGADVELIIGDVTKDIDVKAVDVIFHLAAIPGVQASIDDPLGTTNINVMGTIRALELARRTDAVFVFASSCAVYGDSMEIPLGEDSIARPLSPYATGKRSCEHFIANYNEIYGLEGSALRFFNVYGPRQDPHTPYAAVVPRFITACLEKGDVVIYGNGEQTRDYVYVMDVVRAMEMVAEKGARGIFNVGTGVETSVLELLNVVKDATNHDGGVRFEPPRSGEVPRSRADITKIMEAVAWQPEYDLEAGIKETVAWFRELAEA